MNPNGRIVGSVLIGVAVLWLLKSLGALPFTNTANNQVGTNQAAAQTPPDRPPIQNFDATRPGTGTQTLNPPGNSANDSDKIAQNPAGGTNGTTQQSRKPLVRGAW
ncbi:MAG TPA: hypothetical protein VL134_13095 [Leptolyngbya sp.]|jgi:hypothetical protein|nr:hypothetical protein [Leptolyngbya sp.]